jgi:uncharacterized cupredoxin-like copper-binding protein
LAVVLAACGSDGPAAPERAYTFRLHTDDSGERYRFVADDPIDLRVGDEVTFEMHNTGTLIHDLQITDPGGDTIGVAPAAAPGDSLTLTVRFDEPGFYRLNCLVDDHLTTHRMQDVVEVTAPDA